MVLEQGRIIERGTHDELIAQKGYYYRSTPAILRKTPEIAFLPDKCATKAQSA